MSWIRKDGFRRVCTGESQWLGIKRVTHNDVKILLHAVLNVKCKNKCMLKGLVNFADDNSEINLVKFWNGWNLDGDSKEKGLEKDGFFFF